MKAGERERLLARIDRSGAVATALLTADEVRRYNVPGPLPIRAQVTEYGLIVGGDLVAGPLSDLCWALFAGGDKWGDGA